MSAALALDDAPSRPSPRWTDLHRPPAAPRPSVDHYPVSRAASLGVTSPRDYASATAAMQDYLESFRSAGTLVQDMIASGDIDQPDTALWQHAIVALAPYAARIEKPLVYPLQLGGVSVEWHAEGLDIEIRFRGVGDIFTVVKDARNERPRYLGRDLELARATAALRALAARTVG